MMSTDSLLTSKKLGGVCVSLLKNLCNYFLYGIRGNRFFMFGHSALLFTGWCGFWRRNHRTFYLNKKQKQNAENNVPGNRTGMGGEPYVAHNCHCNSFCWLPAHLHYDVRLSSYSAAHYAYWHYRSRYGLCFSPL